MIKKIFKKLLRLEKKVLETPNINYPVDFNMEEIKLIEKTKSYTMTSPERMVSLIRSIEYVTRNEIEGDFVECGVWRGGSAMIMAKMLYNQKNTTRKIYLYDTYDGMSEPTKEDISFQGDAAEDLMKSREKNKEDIIWAYASLEDVQQNISKTKINSTQVQFIKGKVEDTIPNTIPNKISILRLDTDWYESTYHELTHLFPRLSVGGVIIIDDYGHWEGARKAVDQYFSENKIKILLNRIDYTGRIGIKL